MKTALALLLLISLACHGHALTCHTCAAATEVECNLQGSITCPWGSDACSTITGTGSVLKMCTDKAYCNKSSASSSTSKVACCYSDNCNGPLVYNPVVPPVYNPVMPPVYNPVVPPVYNPVVPPVYNPVVPPVYNPVVPPVYRPVEPPVHIPVRPPVYSLVGPLVSSPILLVTALLGVTFTQL